MTTDFDVNAYKDKLRKNIIEIDLAMADLNVDYMSLLDIDVPKKILDDITKVNDILQRQRKSLAYKLIKYGGEDEKKTPF